MNRSFSFGLLSIVCVMLSGCATTGPYNASSPADRYVRHKCEEYVNSPAYQALPDPKAAFVWRDKETGLECGEFHGGSEAALHEQIRRDYPTATLVAVNGQLMTRTTVRSGSAAPSWSDVVVGGVSAGLDDAAQQRNASQVAAARAANMNTPVDMSGTCTGGTRWTQCSMDGRFHCHDLCPPGTLDMAGHDIGNQWQCHVGSR